ncbi:hypothetical protein B296_00003134 [Ensete ventricosum]|uniref:Uncharacterized protein n=1 Tax=Ensete ventricosum TaxID=4639 RepID=A0A426Z4P5_ENSVE|nr:hypothetical protein B296_00003134 [Ensete ventricosum]
MGVAFVPCSGIRNNRQHVLTLVCRERKPTPAVATYASAALLLLSIAAILSYRFQPTFTVASLSSLLLSSAVAVTIAQTPRGMLPRPIDRRCPYHGHPLLPSSFITVDHPCYRPPRRTLLLRHCQPSASLLSSPRKPLPSLLSSITPSRALLYRTPRCCLPLVPPCHYCRPALGSAQPVVARPSPLPPLSQRCRAQQRCCCCLPTMLSHYRSPVRLSLPSSSSASHSLTAPFDLLTLPACRSSVVVAAPSSVAQPPLPSLLLHLSPLLLPCFLPPLHATAAFLLNCSLTYHVVASLSPVITLTATNRLCPPLADADNLVAVKSYYIYNICP